MVFFANAGAAQHELGKCPLLELLPVGDTQKMFPARTVKETPFDVPCGLETMKLPLVQVEPSCTTSF